MRFTGMIFKWMGLLGLSAALTGCASVQIPGSSDSAAQFLANIFGYYPSDILNSFTTSTSEFPKLFRALNTAILSGAMLILAYIFVMGTIYSAQDGTFLGKKWNKTFVPLRAILGVVAVVPLSTGYCLAQYLIYLVAFVGIWLANAVWQPVEGDTLNPASGTIPGIPGSLEDMLIDDLRPIVFTKGMLVLDGIGDPSQTSTINLPITMTEPRLSQQDITQYKLQPYLDQGSKYIQDPTAQTAYDLIIAPRIDKLIARPAPTTGETVYPGTFSDFDATGVLSRIFGAGAVFYYQNALSFLGNGNAQITSAGIDGSKINSVSPGTLDGIDSLDKSIQSSCSSSTSIDACYKSNSSQFDQILDLTNNNLENASVGPFIPDPNIPVVKITDSWWDAGNEYLDIDYAFAQNLKQLYQEIQNFSLTTDQFNFTITGTLVLHDQFQVIQLMNSDGTIFDSSNNVQAGTKVQSDFQINPNPAISFNTQEPAFSPTQLTAYANALLNVASSWGTNDQNAANDLACRMGASSSTNGVTPCSQVPSTFNSKTPSVLDFSGSNKGTASMGEQLQIHFAIRTFRHNSNQDCAGNSTTPDKACPIYDPADVNAVTQLLEFALQLQGDGGGGGSSPSAFSGNPMIISGENSPMKDALGYIFSGLLGDDGSTTAGLMQEIWCIGAPVYADSSGTEDQSTQFCRTVNGIKPDASDPGMVADHFSMIRQAQLTGLNLISGTVDAMLKIYDNFDNHLAAIIESQDQDTPKAGDLIAAASLGPLGSGWSAALKAQTITAELATSVSIATLSVNLMWLPIIFIVLTVLFITGITFTILMPMMPFILFWSGKITWVLLIVEGLIAGPIWALAIAHPEGHEVWGQGENGFKILINILLMPVLIICGLVSAIILTYAVISMSSTSFHLISIGVLNVINTVSFDTYLNVDPTESSIIVQGIVATFMVFLYAYFIQLAFEKCFSAIYIVPERVMSWIGGQGMKFGEQDMNKVGQQFNQTANQAAQAAGSTVNQGMQADQGVAQAKSKQIAGNANATQEEAQGIANQVWSNAGEAGGMLFG